MKFLLRLIQFALIIFFSTAICAGIFAFSSYFEQYSQAEGSDRGAARERVREDSVEAMKERAFWGGVLGAVGSCLYVVKCLTRGDEP